MQESVGVDAFDDKLGSLRIFEHIKDMISRGGLVDLHFILVCKSLKKFLKTQKPYGINAKLTKTCLELILKEIAVAP